jgi:two-component system chemotaxis response regulator CheY
MNVLIADDEPMTRSLLRRVLTRDCGCTVSEAADGLAALSSCGTTRPDLIITDLRMPVMDGIELIEALRQVPALAAIPVVMMTAARDQGPVHRAIELGVTDYLLKPLQADRVAERLRGVVARVTRTSDQASDDDRTPLLVADGNAEFRQFVATALGAHRVVHQAQSGVAALQRAVETRPGVVLVGGELGLLGPELLMRKLRAAGELAETRIVAVVSKGRETTIPDQADGVLIRTSVADELRAQLSAMSGRGAAAAAGVVAADPSLRSQVAAAAEQVFGMLLHLDVQHTFEAQPRPVVQMIVASVEIEQADREVLTMTLRTDLVSAGKLATGTKHDDRDPVADEDGALAAAADALGMVAGRIKTTLESSGGTVTMRAPTRQLVAAGDLSDGAEGRLLVAVHTADGGCQFVLQLTARAVAGPSPAEAPADPVEVS